MNRSAIRSGVLVGWLCLLLAACGEEDVYRPFTSKQQFEPLQQLDPLIGNVPGRQQQSLNGQWQYIVDQLDTGDISPLLRGGVGTNRLAGPGELLEYRFSDANTLQVPGDWNSQREELFWYRGVIWYQRTFNYSKSPGNRVYLYFGGAYFDKDVYLNGKPLVHHRGGFTPFNTEVGEWLVEGENTVTVKVDSRSGPDQVPTEYNDWLNYGGITRDVLLLEVPATFIRNYKIQLRQGSRDRVAGWVQLDGSDASRQAVTVRIPELGVEYRTRANRQGRAELDFKVDPGLWSPENPKLYRVELIAGTDTLSEEIGFRSIETRGEDILLNGEPVFLRGVSTHEESLLQPGRATGARDAAALVDKLRELNANFVRLAHYPHNEHTLRALDRAGILAWSELPVYHNIAFDNPDTLASAKQQYGDMIARDQNRASVVLWSLANETPEVSARMRFLKDLARHVRQLDDTRLLTAALLGFDAMKEMGMFLGRKLLADDSWWLRLLGEPDPVTMEIDDPLGDVVDVIGYNEYLGWYVSGFIVDEMRQRGMEVEESEVRDLMLEEMVHFRIETDFDKPLIVSEFGAGAKQGLRGGPLDIWSEDYQARVYRSQLAMLENSSALRGLSPWILKDFRAPYRLNTVQQDYWNRKGLVSEAGVSKQAFEVLQQYYRERMEVKQ